MLDHVTVRHEWNPLESFAVTRDHSLTTRDAASRGIHRGVGPVSMVQHARSIVLVSVALTLAVIALGWRPLRDAAREYWYIHKLAADDSSERHRAIDKLRRLDSVRAVPRWIEMAATNLRAPRDGDDELGWAAWEAMRQLTRTRPRSAAAAFARCMQDKDHTVRQVSVEFLGALGDTHAAVFPVLENALYDLDPGVRALAAAGVRTLPESVREATIERLSELLRDPHNTVPLEAARALANAGAKAQSATLALTDALTDARDRVRGHAAEALVSIYLAVKRDRPIDEVTSFRTLLVDRLVSLLGSLVPRTRRAAVYTLGRLGPDARTALPQVLARLDDDSPIVRGPAARTVSSLLEGSSQVDAFVLTALKRLALSIDADREVSRQAARSFARLIARTDNPDAELNDLLNSWGELDDDQVRFLLCSAIDSLLRLARSGSTRSTDPAGATRRTVEALAAALHERGGAHATRRRRRAPSGRGSLLWACVWLLDGLGAASTDAGAASTDAAVTVRSIALKHSSSSIRIIAAWLLGKSAGTPESAAALTSLREVLRSDRSSHVRARAAEALARLAPSAVDDEMLAPLRRTTFHASISNADPGRREGSAENYPIDAVKLPPGFAATIFYSGIPSPDGVAVRDDNTLFVVNESDPTGVFVARRGDSFDPADAFSAIGPPFVSPDDIFLAADGTIFVSDIQARVVFTLPRWGGQPLHFAAVGAAFAPHGMVEAPLTFRGSRVRPGDLIVADNGYGQPERWAVWALGSSSPRAIAQGRVFVDHGPSQVAFTPTRELMVYQNRDAATTRIVKLASDGTVTPLVVGIRDRGGMDVHPVTGDVYFGLQEKEREIWWAPPAGGTGTVFAIGFDDRIQDLHFRRDGRALYVSVRNRILEITGPFERHTPQPRPRR